MACTDRSNDVNNALHTATNNADAPTVTLRYSPYMN